MTLKHMRETGKLSMNHEEKQYLNLMQNIINRGYESDDRTGVGTFSEFGVQLKFSLENNTIPVFTTKRIFYKAHNHKKCNQIF